MIHLVNRQKPHQTLCGQLVSSTASGIPAPGLFVSWSVPSWSSTGGSIRTKKPY